MTVKDWHLVEDLLTKQKIGFRRASEIPALEVIPSGIKGLDDVVIGVGGFPRGTVCEINGPNASCKTTICLHVVARCQQMGGKAALLNAEGAYNPNWGEAAGIDNSELLLPDFNTGEMAYKITRMLIHSGVDLIITDSLNALVPEVIGVYADAWLADGDETDDSRDKKAKLKAGGIAEAARMNSTWLRVIVAGSPKVPAICRTRTCFIFTNHVHTVIGGPPRPGRPPLTVPSGGKGAAYNTHIRINTRVCGWEVAPDGTEVKVEVEATTDRNRVALPRRKTKFWMNLIRNEPEEDPRMYVEVALANGLAKMGGSSWITWLATGEKYQGSANFRKALEENEEMRAAIISAQRGSSGG